MLLTLSVEGGDCVAVADTDAPTFNGVGLYQREQAAQQRADYEAAEATAKAGKEGLWRDVGALPPWEWRHK